MANGNLNQMIANSLFRINPTLRDSGLNQAIAGNLRPDNTLKGTGYFGVLPRPGGGVSTELSTGVDFGQGETLIPLLVPTLNKTEVDHLLSTSPQDPIPRPILDKAVSFAKQRLSSGLSPFASNDEIPYGIKLGEKSPEWKAMQSAMTQQSILAGLPAITEFQDEAPSRARLIDAIARLESTGIKVPHFIGSSNEPTGDRGVTMDIEELVKGLRTLEKQARNSRDMDALSKISSERAYWEKEAADGMSAAEWKSQTGESDPLR